MWAVEKGDVIGARRAAAERGKDSQGNDGEPRYGSDERRREPGAAQEPNRAQRFFAGSGEWAISAAGGRCEKQV